MTTRRSPGLIALYLRKHGYETTVAGDGDTADRLLREESFDLALLDIMLPGPAASSLCARSASEATCR